MGNIDFDHWWAARCGKGCRLIVGEGAADDRSCYLGDLVAVHEAQAVAGLHRDAVEQVQLRDLEYVVDLADLGSRRGDDGRTDC